MKAKRFQPQVIGQMIGLVAQYLLGMLTNLYVTFPKTNSVGQRWEFARSQVLVMAHIVLGTLIFLGAIALIIRAYKSRERIWKISAGIGLVSITLAWISGEEFISSQAAGYSLSMSLFFLVALAAYGWGLYRSRA